MNQVADTNGIEIIVDAVFNQTVDVTEQPDPPFVELSGNSIAQERFPQFEPAHFHERCPTEQNEQTCWLSNNLADLSTTDPTVRARARAYLQKLQALGADGFRFDAAIHVEPEFYSDVLDAVPGAFAFGEIIKDRPSDFADWLVIAEMDYYDFPLTRTMREAFGFGGDLRTLRNPKAGDRALDEPNAITFVRNHDIVVRISNAASIAATAGRVSASAGTRVPPAWIGPTSTWPTPSSSVERTVCLTSSSTCPRWRSRTTAWTTPRSCRNPFPNLCLAGHGGVARRPEVWRIETANAIGFQRGDDRFVVINKAAETFRIRNLQTSLRLGNLQGSAAPSADARAAERRAGPLGRAGAKRDDVRAHRGLRPMPAPRIERSADRADRAP